MIAIGRFYDPRISILGINLSWILSLAYFITIYYLTKLVHQIKLNTVNVIQIIFYFVAIISTLSLWLIYGVNQDGLDKLLVFTLITFPVSILISQIFSADDAHNLLRILFGFSCILLLISLMNISSLASLRQGVLGGGPIVLARWLGLGAIVCFFYNPIKKYRWFLFPLFIIIALFTGSRGPFYSILIILFIYLFINFRRIFFRSISVILVLFSIIYFSGIANDLPPTVSRVFMNFLDGGLLQSTQGRSILLETSLNQLFDNPFGVGLGNWQEYADNKNFLVAHKPPLYYPHNIFMEIICELGIFTGLLFFVYVIKVFFDNFRSIIHQKNNLHQVIFYIFAYLLFNSMISGDLSDARLLFIFMSLISINNFKYVNNM
tara:strand:- start:352 stop:1482 length:1131 start_codon:yes stop_codon:yes gene_type:complete